MIFVNFKTILNTRIREDDTKTTRKHFIWVGIGDGGSRFTAANTQYHNLPLLK